MNKYQKKWAEDLGANLNDDKTWKPLWEFWFSKFYKWAEDKGINLDESEDWGPWWECWWNGCSAASKILGRFNQ